MENFTFTTAYNRDEQTYVMERFDNVKITGGRILFTYRFNYTRLDFNSQTNITGYAEGNYRPMQVQSYPIHLFISSKFLFAMGSHAGSLEVPRRPYTHRKQDEDQ